MYALYVLYSPSIRRFYVGITSDLEKRLYYHNHGRSPYTKGKGPWRLVYSEDYRTKQQAIRREREIKSWKSSKRIIKELGIVLGSSGPVVTG